MRTLLNPGQGGYRFLLLSFISLLVLRPIVEAIETLPWLLPLLMTVVLLACVRSVSHKRGQVIGVAVLAFIAVGGEWGWIPALVFHPVVPSLAVLLTFSWVAVLLAQDVFRERDKVSADMIYGAINTYLLVTFAFAAAYQAHLLVLPGSFNGLTDGASMADAMYFSAVTITTLGYGDISPIASTARTLAFTEALFGQFYIAVLLGKLVATYISSSTTQTLSESSQTVHRHT
jgi:voltage-gated potassium channel Kch